MYKTHQRAIAKFSKESPDNLKWTKALALTSIRQDFWLLRSQLLDLKKYGVQSKYLFGSKRAGWEYILNNKEILYDKIYSNKISLAEKLLEVASIPNIGLAKGGFILQLTLGKVGCLDTHNLHRFGIPPTVFKLGKLKYNTALRKAEYYIKTCEDLGGSEYLWNSWCEFVAEKYPWKYKNANQVSKLHVDHILSAVQSA
tara:strand:+ start:2773 stop:3369 length:597 start_codon:yes stop_codon:yes gene_type:complete